MYLTQSKNSLGFADVLDGVELVEALEQEFRIKLSDDDFERIETVGKLHDLLCDRISLDANSPCMTARAFRRIVGEFDNDDTNARPSTSLTQLAGVAGQEATHLRKLNQRTSLSVDVSITNPWTWIMAAAAFVLPLVLDLSFGSFLIGCVLASLVAFSLGHMLPRQVPRDVTTLGDVVHRTMNENWQNLRADGATGTQRDLWHFLCSMCRDMSGYTGPIDRNTTFYD